MVGLQKAAKEVENNLMTYLDLNKHNILYIYLVDDSLYFYN